MSLGIKKGDKVAVICGKDKGKTGKVLKVIQTIDGQSRIMVEGVNLVKKHLRRRSENEPGGIKEIPLALAFSNVALFCPGCAKGTRFGVKVLSDKSKVRVCKKCQKTL